LAAAQKMVAAAEGVGRCIGTTDRGADRDRRGELHMAA
jgi:hypothetical protein